MGSWIALLLIGACIVLEGGFLALVPWLQRRHECFSVTVPPAAQEDARLKRLKIRYTAIMTVLSLVFCAIAVWCVAGSGFDTEAGQVRFVTVILVESLLLCLVSFVLMLLFRQKVKAIKKQEGWEPKRTLKSATLSQQDAPRPISLAWNLAYVPVILATVAICVACYDSMPDMIAMHADFQGNVTDSVPKSPVSVGFPVLVQLFLAAAFVFSHWSMRKSKHPVDPSAPAASALAYGMFARAQSIFLLVMGLTLCVCLGLALTLSNIGLISLAGAAALIVIAALVAVVGSVVLSLVYGQAGSRVFSRLQGEDLMLEDEDEHWKLGIFYFNPQDPSIFLPERFGVGWTVNLARPATWAIMLAIVAVTVAFLVALFLLL